MDRTINQLVCRDPVIPAEHGCGCVISATAQEGRDRRSGHADTPKTAVSSLRG